MVETLDLRTGSGDPSDHAKFVEPLRELYEQVVLLAGTHFFYGNSNFEKNIMIGLQDRYFNMGNIFMKGFLTVTGTLRSNQNSTFEVYGESRITINSTGLVESIGCGNFWPGIKMDMHSSFYAFPGARLRQMRNGINFGGPESNPPGLGFTPGCALTVDHLQLEDNYRNFVFYLPATGHIRNTVATYTGNLRVKPEANCIDNGFDAAECGELGFSFISFLRGESYNNQTTPNNLKIEDNQISRYMSGIYCQNLMGGNSNIAFTMERCTLSSYNRAVNFLSNTTATLKGNTFRPAIVGANNRDQYIAAMQATGADNIGAMYGDQVQYCGVYSGANFCNILAEGNEFYGLGSTDPSAWDYGIHVRGSGSTLNLTGNLFNGLRKGLNIFSGTHNVQNFRCNTFVPHTAISTNLPCYGIVVGLEPGNPNPTTAQVAGPIGNSGIDDADNPSGNVWPVDPASLAANPISGGPAVINNWQSPQGWTSLRNDNTDFNLIYWAYNNEFVWPPANDGPNAIVRKRDINGEQIMMYRTGIPNPPVDDPGTVVYRPQCSTDLPDVFPLRMAADPGSNSITSVLNSEIGSAQKALLGDAVPNPAPTQVKIPVFIPESSMLEYHLTVFDLNGKNVLLKLPLVQKGRSLVELSLGDLPAGVYGYRLTENGKALGTRKLVLIK